MTQKELFEKLYNDEIKEKDVIVETNKKGEEFDRYILNDGFDYWYFNGDGVISLIFLKKDDDYEYKIISLNEFKAIMQEKERQEKIERLKRELSTLEG